MFRELETSMILRLRPELVKMEAAQGTNIPFESAFYSPYASKGSRVSVVRMFEHVTDIGALGHPEMAKSGKGEALYQTATAEVVGLIRKVASWSDVRTR
tara:strand:+ start:145 stop:441 length:297 start_codon:yes stop_codon:yes gene_type:complete